MTIGSPVSGGIAAAPSGSLLCAIWLVLSVFLVGLVVTLTAGTDKFSSRRNRATRREGIRAVSV